jgi:glycosyltransferase involved in cell wall biosynthesis
LRICVLAPFDLGLDVGATIVVRSLLKWWRRDNFVSLITDRTNSFHIEGVEEIVVDASSYRSWLLNSFQRLPDLLDYDVLLDESYTFPILNFMKLTRQCSTFLHSHGVLGLGANDGITTLSQFRNYAERFLSARSSNSIIVASELHKRALVSCFGASIDSRIHPLWHGVNPEDFPESVPTGKRILFVGNTAKGDLFERKGIKTLIKAFSKLSKEIPDARLSAAGSADNRLARSCEEFGVSKSVDYLGGIKHDRLSAIYGASRVLVLPSVFDTYGQVVNEAMSCGIPVIVSDGVGSAEVVKSAGCGLVFKTGDAQALYKCLKSIFDDDKMTIDLGRRGSKFARNHLRWETIAARYIDLFKPNS